MKCQKCGNYDATTHITQMINGNKTEIYLCPYCAEENNGVWFNSVFDNSFEDFFSSIWNTPKFVSQTTSNVKKCSVCGSTLAEIQKSGRLGCSECYNTFFDVLLKPLKEIHGSNVHTGKYPRRSGKELSRCNEINRLKDELNRAVLDQNFERAAELRDKIRELENQ